MTDPNTVPYFAHKMPARPGRGEPYYLNASPSRGWVELFGFPEPIVKVSVRERLPTDPPSNYWGWLSTDFPEHYQLVWPSEIQLDICFFSGPKVAEERGRGRKVNLMVEELP